MDKYLVDVPYSKEIEKEVFKIWEEKNAYKRVKEKKGGKKFFFMDGPPYASGEIHMGHAWNKAIKDAYIRFYRLNGYDVFDVPGWDTHGTPIEVQVEKELGVKSKKDIEKIGIEDFVKKCEEFATKYVGKMTNQFKDLGVWMDWENAYMTLRASYIEAAWWTFKKAWEKGLIEKGKYPVHVCPRCETVVSFAEVEYKELEDPSIYVKFPSGDEYLLVWTTTPWTLPANAAIMAHPEEEYVLVEVDNEKYILAEKRLEHVAKELGWVNYKILEVFKGKELEGKEYESVLDVPCQEKAPRKVVLSERYVSMEEGTGLVHTAPGHGKEDYIVGKEYGLPVISPVRPDGTFTEEAGKYKGMFVKDADKLIIKDLKEKGLLAGEGKIKHNYPICWRCKTPLLFLAVDEWFCRIDEIHDLVLKEAEKVNWSPPWGKERFRDWVMNLKDWPVSRQRFWGIPVPIWECKCGYYEVIGSVDELKERGAEVPEDLHRPWIDNVTYSCPKCGGMMKRVEDVLDVWFDSGITTWAVLEYPKREDLFKKYWPADLEVEGVDQIRGWWNSQMLTSIIAFGKAPYKNIIMHGLVLDIHGIKMSKSLGNVIQPEDVIEKYTRDALRAYLLSRPLGVDINFDWEEVKEYYGFLNTYWNLYKLLARFLDQFGKWKEGEAVEDRWIMSRVNTLIKEVKEDMEKLRHDRAMRKIKEFVVEDLSRKYVKMVRERMKEGEAYGLLYEVLKKLVVITSPFVPFVSEYIYQKLFGEKETVFLEDYPEPGEMDKELEEKMEKMFRTAEEILALRHKVGLKLRWPIRSVAVTYLDELSGAEDALKKYVNAKEVVDKIPPDFATKETPWGTVGIPKKLGKEEWKEAMAREVLRRIQEERKKMGLMEKDRIFVYLWGEQEIMDCVKAFEDFVKERASIEELYFRETDGKEFKIEGKTIKLKIEVV